MGHNNYRLRDLRSNRAHPIVHIDRLRRFRGTQQLPADHFVVDRLLDVRRVSVAQARGPSRVEFLVKWRQYTKQDATWEPMEELRATMEDEVEEFLQKQAHHPAIRAWRTSRNGTPPPPKRSSPTSAAAAGAFPSPSAPLPRAAAVCSAPTATAYKRGVWHYSMLHRRPNGREYERWLPSVAFSTEELDSDHFQQLRRLHLDSLPSEEAAIVALVLSLGDDSELT